MNPGWDPELIIQGGAPLVEQIRTQLRDHMVCGQLAPGDELPTVRAIAVALAINPDAVEQAYALLEQEGFLTSAEGSGYRVVGGIGSRREPLDEGNQLSEFCQEFLSAAAYRGFSSTEVLAHLQQLSAPAGTQGRWTGGGHGTA